MSRHLNCRLHYRPDFFEPKPRITYANRYINTNANTYTNNQTFICKSCQQKLERRKPILKRRCYYQKQVASILGKRQLEEAFGSGMNDKERYGQEIPSDFFKTNIGHTVYKNIICEDNIYKDKLTYWRNKYLGKR